MILADTSVWIDFLRGRATARTDRLKRGIERNEIVVGDLVLCELLQGAASDEAAAAIEDMLEAFPILPMGGRRLAVRAAANYRHLRQMGVTVRKTIDVLIGTYCIENGLALLHADRDFDPMERYLRLKVA